MLTHFASLRLNAPLALLLSLSLFALPGCPGRNSNSADSSIPDSRVVDSNVIDNVIDSSVVDGNVLDGNVVDSTVLDNTVVDSGVDSIVLDSVIIDGTVLDSGDAAIDAATADADVVSLPRGPAPVLLGASSNLAAPGSYVLLAKTGITNATGSTITGGHVGLSPAAATFITGFSLIADPSTVFSTSSAVVSPSRVYASNYGVPTPTNLTTAVLAMQAAYADAAGRLMPDSLNLGSGQIGGRTLAPGLYKWGTTVTIPTDVTLSGGSDDVWILQIDGDLDLSTSRRIILSGGARARNIFWQVTGQATIHVGAHFEGVILSQTSITLQTNATMIGRALAQSLVAIDNNAITAP